MKKSQGSQAKDELKVTREEWERAGSPRELRWDVMYRFADRVFMSKEEMIESLKPSNPKDSVGIKKVYFSVIPWGVVAELGLALLEGALKYGRHNYRGVGVRASVYMDASIRHLADWWEGEDIDPDSGLSHITKAIAGLTVLRDSMIKGNWEDDRPPRMEAGWMKELNKKAAALVEKYPNPEKVWTEK